MKIFKPKFWSEVNLLSLLFLPFSLVTMSIYLLKEIIPGGKSFKIPIICVGNIYVGGTGKTPLSIYIFNLLKKKKFNPALIRKYYKSHSEEIDLTKSKVGSFFSNKKRISSIFDAKKSGNKVIVMDDGMQDTSVKKSLNIICFNSFDLVGNGFLLPAGPLREPLMSLKKGKIVVINGEKNNSFERKIKKISKNLKIFYSKYILKDIYKYKGKKLLAFAGIGSPNNFFKLLKKNNLKVEKEISFPDHYGYKKRDIQNLIDISKKKDLKLITTEKDFFKIKKMGYKKIAYISIDVKILKQKKFEGEILKYL